jgi:hypothetical protein
MTDINEAQDQKKVQPFMEGAAKRAFYCMVNDEDDEAAGWRLLARQVRAVYMEKIGSRKDPLPVSTVEEAEQDALKQLLDPNGPWPPEARAALRRKLQLPEEPPASETSTNAVPPSVSTIPTNAVAPPK